jgi:multiple sugar transport system substrate-binding protein
MKIGQAPGPVGRWLTAAVAGLVMLAASGCGGDDSGSSKDNKPLRLWVRAGEDSVKDYKALAAEFTKQTGVKVDVFGTVTDFDQRLNAAASAKDLPDVITAESSTVNSLVQRKLVTEVDRNSIKGGADVNDRAWKSAQTADGKYWGVPLSAQAFQLLIRSDWRKKVGAAVPKTWDEMIALAKKFTTGDPDGNGKNDTYGMVVPASTQAGYASWYWSTYLFQAGGDFVQDAGGGKAKPMVNSPEAVNALTFFKSWFCTDKIVQPGAVNTVTVDAHKVFESGQGGMYLTGPYNFERFDKNLGKAKYEVVDPPAGPKGDTVLAEGTTTYFMVGSKKQDEAKKLAEFFITPEIQKTAMTQPGAGSIVRLPVNNKVDINTVMHDQRWTDNLRLYNEKGRYLPNVLGWGAMRQSSAEAVNKAISNCGSDPKKELDAANEKFSETLQKSNALAQ